MLPLTTYLFDAIIALACIAALVAGGRAVQLRFLKEVVGPELIVVRAVAGFALLTTIAYVLGSVGLFSRGPLAVGFIAIGLGAHFALSPRDWGRRSEGRLSAAAGLPLAAGLLLLLTIWLLPVDDALRNGMRGTDTLWYHMPFALRFFQDQSLTSVAWNEPLFQTYFYPSWGSMFHALGMVFFHRDFLSPLVNVGWLALAVTAGGAIGARRGVAAASALGVGAVFVGDKVLGGSAGAAMVDAPATFFFLAATVLLLRSRECRAAVVLCGLAIGLGVSIKLTIALPGAGVLAAVVLLARRGTRFHTAIIWSAGALATSWFWFARNISETGSPLPMIDIPFLSNPGKALESVNMVPIAKYFTDPNVMLHQLPSAWTTSLGLLAVPMILFGFLAPLALAVKPREPYWRAASLVALVALTGYFFTPGTAAGPPGGPILGLVWDTRFIAPGLCLGLALLPVWLSFRFEAKRVWLTVPMGVLVVVPALGSKSWDMPHTLIAIFASAALLTGLWLITTRVGPRTGPARLVTYAALALLAVGFGRGWESRQIEGRALAYGPSAVGQAPERIAVLGVAGTFSQYLESDAGLTNRVQFVGTRGPNGAFDIVRSCPVLFAELNAGRYGYVVAAPNRDVWNHLTVVNPQVAWLQADPNAAFVKTIPGLKLNYPRGGPRRPEPFPVYRIKGQLQPSHCPR